MPYFQLAKKLKRFHLVLKDMRKIFDPRANYTWFQRVTVVSFQPSLILCAMLRLLQKILSHYHYFLCLNNYYNVQVASFGIFLKFTLKSWSKNWKKHFFYEKNEKLTNWDNQIPCSSPRSSSLKRTVLEPKNLNCFYIVLP